MSDMTVLTQEEVTGLALLTGDVISLRQVIYELERAESATVTSIKNEPVRVGTRIEHGYSNTEIPLVVLDRMLKSGLLLEQVKAQLAETEAKLAEMGIKVK